MKRNFKMTVAWAMAIMLILCGMVVWPASANSESTLIGDINLDGDIDVEDLLLLKKHILKISVLDGQRLTNADMSEDGKVDVEDLLVLKKIILKILPKPTTTEEATTAPQVERLEPSKSTEDLKTPEAFYAEVKRFGDAYGYSSYLEKGFEASVTSQGSGGEFSVAIGPQVVFSNSNRTIKLWIPDEWLGTNWGTCACYLYDSSGKELAAYWLTGGLGGIEGLLWNLSPYFY